MPDFSINAYLFQDGTILDDGSELDHVSLIDAVLPDIVTTRHTLLHNRGMKPEIGIKLEDGHYAHVNSMGHGEMMEIDGTVNDAGSNKALILKGHEHEVELLVFAGKLVKKYSPNYLFQVLKSKGLEYQQIFLFIFFLFPLV